MAAIITDSTDYSVIANVLDLENYIRHNQVAFCAWQIVSGIIGSHSAPDKPST